MPTGDTEKIMAQETKRSPDESIKPLNTPSNSFAPKLTWNHNSKITADFGGSCLKQNKAIFVYKNYLYGKLIYCL